VIYIEKEWQPFTGEVTDELVDELANAVKGNLAFNEKSGNPGKYLPDGYTPERYLDNCVETICFLLDEWEGEEISEPAIRDWTEDAANTEEEREKVFSLFQQVIKKVRG
jgi:hypothetical protein